MSMFKPLHLLFSSGRDAAHPVCHDGSRFVNWHEFACDVEARVASLQDRSESRWLLASNDPKDFCTSLLALLHAGKQVVIPPNSQAGTIAQLDNVFDAVVDGQAWPVSKNSPGSLAPINPHTAIIDIYTSGSTGEPKQIRKTLAQFEAEIIVLESLWGSTLGQATIVASAPHYHFYGLLFRLFWPLAAGRPFDTVTCLHPDVLAGRLRLLRDVVLVSSPALLSRLPELVPLDSLQPQPRIIFSSGGPLPRTVAREFHRQLGTAPTEVFGSTETGGIAWRCQENDDIWTVMPGIHIESGVDGALLLLSPYILGTELWRMDDAVEILSEECFYLRGRLDRIVKIEEKRLSLPDMEGRLAKHPWVATAAAVALPGRRQTIGAVVVLNTLGRQQLVTQSRRAVCLALRRHLAEHFDTVLLPRRWRFPEQLPFNDRGKLTNLAVTELLLSAEYASSIP